MISDYPFKKSNFAGHLRESVQRLLVVGVTVIILTGASLFPSSLRGMESDSVPTKETATESKTNSSIFQSDPLSGPSDKSTGGHPGPPGANFPIFSVETDGVTSFGGTDSFSMAGFKLGGNLAAPVPPLKSLLMISPHFGMDSVLSSPDDSRLPEALYRTGVNFSFLRPLNERWSLLAGTGVNFSSDFKSDSSDAFQIPAFFMTRWKRNERWDWTFGIAYTDSEDWKFIPFAGFSWRPNDEWKIDVMMPRPKVSRRINSLFSGKDTWLFLAGEYGGGSWSVERSWERGDSDLMKYQDFRLMIGLEPNSTPERRFQWVAEIGTAFERKVDFDNSPNVYRPDPGIVGRLKISF